VNVRFYRSGSRVQGFVVVDLRATVVIFCVWRVGATDALLVLLLNKQAILLLLIIKLETSFLIINRFEDFHRTARAGMLLSVRRVEVLLFGTARFSRRALLSNRRTILQL
jgi:hypothetical protein